MVQRDRFVEALPDGRYRVEFPSGLRGAVLHLATQLEQNLEADHPDLQRLFPTAYNTDAERDAGYQILARPQLIDGKREAIATVSETIHNEELTEEEISCWLRIINDIRLVLGTRLDVSEEDDFPEPDDPKYEAYEVYYLLGLMLEHIVHAMSTGLD